MKEKLHAINELVLACAAGRYQAGLVAGQNAWSGGDLRGPANEWGATYKRSRDNLLRRINSALRHSGWKAELGYALMGSPRRWHVRLFLVDPEGRRYDQITGNRAQPAEKPEAPLRRPGFTLREAAR